MHIFKAPHQTQSSGQFYISATLPKQKVPSIPVEEEAEWTPEPACTRWRRDEIHASDENRTPVVQPVAQSLY